MTDERKQSEATHTPLPWEASTSLLGEYDIYSEGGTHGLSHNKANMYFIATACNSHYDLLAENKMLREALEALRLHANNEYTYGMSSSVNAKWIMDHCDKALAKRKGAEG